METTKRVTGVLYLDRTNFIYIDTSVGGLVQFQYPLEVISDLEVLHEDELFNQVSTLIQTNKISPTQVVIILATGLLFEKKIPVQTDPLENGKIIEKFIETVPFESVSFTKLPVTDGIQVMAANTNFFTSMKDAFQRQGFQIMSVFPIDVFQEDITNGIQVDSAVRILGKVDSLKQYNLLQKDDVILPSEKKTEMMPQDKKSKNRLYIMGGIFLGLILILVIMLLGQN